TALEQLGKREEEDQRKQVVEKQYAAVAKRQPHVGPKQRQVRSHSRRLFPVSSMNASSREGRLMRISDSSIPWASSHLTISTTTRAGRRETTAMRVRASSTVVFSASGHWGSPAPFSGREHSTSMVAVASVRS